MVVIKIRYQSTNCYLLDTGSGLLAFDAGWPNTFREYKDCLKEQGYSVKDIRWLVVSHFHIDHAGLAGVFCERGVMVIVFPNQLAAIPEMEALLERKKIIYRKLDASQVHVLAIHESRRWLAGIGIAGEVLHTNGHGEQSISLLLDSGEAFIGDLAPEAMVSEEDEPSKHSWALLRSKGAQHIRPAHAPEFWLT
jgi:glyoxylase-like metal-dependent hydrolase (beta-lactamase superfamily II)